MPEPNLQASTLPSVVTASDQTRRAVHEARKAGKRIGVVMTMGALHEGHLSLAQACAEECDFSVLTIFVNPTQFGPHEDFTRYPRELTKDLELLRDARVDVVYAPGDEEVYRPGHSTYVEPPQVAQPLEGLCRPGHFRGVTTVVLKLLHAVPADVAYFGQKDYQQCLVVRNMVRDLDVPAAIRVCPTVREADGLARSSRNRYLSDADRARAAAIYASLQLAQTLVHQGVRHVAEIVAKMRSVLLESQIDAIDYVTLADPETLEDLREVDRRAIALIAARVGATRLIDNLFLTLR